MGEQAEKGGAAAEVDAAGQAEIEGRAGPRPGTGRDAGIPPAGPHEKPALTNPEATPGTGSLPTASDGDEADASTG